MAYPDRVLSQRLYFSMEQETLKHWILTDPSTMGGDLAGLRTPDAVSALVIDGFSTDNGTDFEYPPFEAGRQDAVFMVLPAESGQRVFEGLSRYVAGRQSLKENLEDENEVVAAIWNLSEEKVAILVADSSGSEHIQNAFEQRLMMEKIYLQRSGAVIDQLFDASKVLEEGRAVFNSEAREALTSLLKEVPAPAASRGRRPSA